MSSIYDIAGTSSDSFSMNGKCTLLQGDTVPESYQGLDGDVYFQSNGAVYAKRNGAWLNLTSAALPDADTVENGIVYSNGENYGFYELPITDIAFKSQDNTFTGNNIFENTIQGTAYRAMFGDLAEYYESDNQYPKGTLVQFGGEKEITIANNEVNAVITSEPGFILNSQMENGQAIALCGRVPVRVIGTCEKFDYLTLSNIAGVATRLTSNYTYTLEGLSLTDDKEFSDIDFEKMPNIIARALENKDNEEEGLVLCVVKFDI